MKKNEEKVIQPRFESHEIFAILKNEKTDGKFVILIANGLATSKRFDTIKAAKDYIDSKPWDLIASMVAAMVVNLKSPENNVQPKN